MTTQLTSAFQHVFRDNVTQGVPTSGKQKINKSEARGLGGIIDGVLSSVVSGLTVGSAVIYSTRAALFADLARPAGMLGVVFNDSTPAYNGVYLKAGASGTGSWSITGLALPATFSADLADVIGDLASHVSNGGNPHNVTKAQVGLGNVDNTSDVLKPVSTAQSTAINAAVTALSAAINEANGFRFDGDNALYTALAALDTRLSAAINATQDFLDDERDERIAQDASLLSSIGNLPTFAERLSQLGSAETARLWSSVVTGDPATRPTIAAAEIVTDSEGKVVRVVGAAIRAPRFVFRMEPGRIYRVRGAMRRRQNPTDPTGDSVRLQLAFLTAGKAFVPSLGVVTGKNWEKPYVTDGRQITEFTVGLSGAVDVIASPGTVYFSPFWQTFGADAVTDLEFLQVIDQSGQTPVTADITALTAQVAALQSIDASVRLTAVEAFVTGSEIIQFATRAAFTSTAVISSSVKSVNIQAFSSTRPPAPALYKRVSPAPSHSAYITHPNGSFWELSEKVATPEMWGAAGDDTTNDSAAFSVISNYCRVTGAALDLTRRYYVESGSTALDLSGFDVFATTNVRLRGNVLLQDVSLRVSSDLNVLVDTSGVKYPYRAPRVKTFAEKSIWLGDGDLIRDVYTRIDPGSLSKERITWPSGDTRSADPLPIAADENIGWALTGDGRWHLGLRPAIGGRELSAVFSAGSINRGAFVFWSGGYVTVYAGNAGPIVAVKNNGVAISQNSLSWPGLSDHPQWLAENAMWGIRIYDARNAAFVINGTEVYRFTLPVGALITDYGFGVMYRTTNITAGISRWTEKRTTAFSGQRQTAIVSFGDSLTSPFHGGWQEACREALDGTFGIRATYLINNAIAGTNSFDAWTRMQAVGLGVGNYITIGIGTNDIQGGAALSASISNMTSMLDYVIAAGRVPVVIIPPLWLAATQTSDGFVTANSEKGAELRAAYMTLAASKGALIVDLQQITGQILATFVNSPDASDQRVRDRIHPTAYVYRLVGQYIARVIAGDIVKTATPVIDQTPIPSVYLVNGWTSATRAPFIRADSQRNVVIEGIADAGTKTAGTAIFQLPANLRPSRTVSFDIRSSRTSDGRLTRARLELDSSGAAKIYDMPSDDNLLYLDGVAYQAA